MSTRTLITLAALAATLVAAVPDAAAKRLAPRGFYGVMWNRAGTETPEALQPGQFALMARSGVESVRTVFSWSDAQPVAGRPPDFGATDRTVALAAARRISLLPVVLYTPTWAEREPGVVGTPPAFPADYAAYVSALVGRYGPRGSFWREQPALPRRPIRHWQIWNEPHLPKYWSVADGESWATGYTQLLRAAHDAIKRADPGATVVTAGLASFPWTYLDKIYRAGGRGAFDAAAINLFTGTPEYVLRGARLTRRAMRKRGDARKQVWVTETTWPASKGLAPAVTRAPWQTRWETTDSGMARRLAGLYALAAKRRRRDGLGRVFWYTWATYYNGAELFDYDGLLRYDGQGFRPNPALAAYAKSARRHQGCRKTSSGLCRP